MKILTSTPQRSWFVCLLLACLLPITWFTQPVNSARAAQPNKIKDTTSSGWDARFGALGPEDAVTALAITANGDLYAGGEFQAAGGMPAKHIARWDGTRWQPLGEGLDGTPKAMAVDGNTLYVIGSFTKAGTVTVNQLARWDGSTWSVVGTGAGPMAELENNGWLDALAVSNGKLYVGGHFESYEGVAALNIVQWDGSKWSAIGKGVGKPDTDGILSSYGNVNAILVDGSQVYAGGDIGMADDQRVNAIAQWDGSQWRALGTGLTDNDYEASEWGTVSALAKRNGILYAAGRFLQAGGKDASHIASWDGTQWSALGAGILNPPSEWDVPVSALLATGDTLYVGGTFQGVGGESIRLLAQWRNNTWSQVGSGMDKEGVVDRVYALALGADGSIYSAGRHQLVGDKRVDHVARWDGSTWHRLNNGLVFAAYGDKPAEVQAILEDGAGRVYAAGLFGVAGGNKVNNLALLENGVWRNIGGSNERIYALALDGDYLYVGGAFSEIGGMAANHIARWHRASGQWSTLGTGINGNVHTLAFKNGILYAGGAFNAAGTVAAEDVAWWDGSAWHAFGTKARIFGVINTTEAGTYVNALAVHGDLVVIGGAFTTIQFGTNTADRNSFVKVNHLVAWNRVSDAWFPVGTQTLPGVTFAGNNDLDIGVHALQVVGDLLFVGGKFSKAGTLATTGLGCWDLVNHQWIPFNTNLGSPNPVAVRALASSGSDLIVGGNFLSAGDAGIVNFVARFDMLTEKWSGLDGGVKWYNDSYTEVLSLSASTTGVYVGGKFDKAGGLSASGFARWNGTLRGDGTPATPTPTPTSTPLPGPQPDSNQTLRVFLPVVVR